MKCYLSNPRYGILGLCLPIDLPLIYHCCCKSLSFSSLELWYHVDFPLIFKLGLNSVFKIFIDNHMNIFYKYATEYKVIKKKSQHHITILTLLFWVWKPPKKPKMVKLVQQSDIDFIMRKYGTFTITTKSPKPSECNTRKESLGKSQLNLNTLLCECTT